MKEKDLNALIKNIEADPYEMRQFLDAVSLHDIYTFSEHILGFDNADHHKEWYDILESKLITPIEANWDSELVKAPKDFYSDSITVLAPRSHSKSTVFTVNYPLHEIGKNRNIRILIVSATNVQAVSFLREIKGQMIKNNNYRRMFGDLFPENILQAEKWTDSEIIVRRSNSKLKDPTVAVTSAGGGVLGRRADIIICDDILNEKIVKTAEQRAKTLDWFNTVLLPVLEPNGRLVIVGTVWNTEGLYHVKMKDKTFQVRKRYKAIIDHDKKVVLWPNRWNYEKLMIRKQQMGSTSFSKSYQNEAISAEDQIFQAQWLEDAKSGNRKLLYSMDYSKWDLGQLTITGGMDLAISQKEGSDFTATAVIGRTRDGIKIPLYLSREKLSPKETRQLIVELFERFPSMKLLKVENNAYQDALVRDMVEMTDLPIKGYTTGGEKFDEEIGINSLAVDFENGKWILPYSEDSPRTQKLIDILVSGLLAFPSGHTEDLVMALWFANSAMRDMVYGKKRNTVSFGRGKLI